MAGYLGSTPVPQATQHRESFTATSGQTTFATAGYTAGFVDVYLNGSHLSPADFTATNGSDVVLASGASADDVCDIISHSAFELNAQTFTGTTTMDVVTATGVVTANAGVVIDEMTLDADTLTATDDFIIDAAGDIKLSADDNGVIGLFDGSVQYGSLFESSNSFFITSKISDGDIVFQGNDGGSTITALTIDMSAGGNVGIGMAPDAAVKLSISGSVGTTNGTAGSPTHTFYGDADSGMFRAAANAIAFSTGGSERVRIAANGDFHWRKSSQAINTGGVSFINSASYVEMTRDQGTALYVNRTTNDGTVVEFARQGTTVGTISVNGSATAFNTSSDYRLKKDAQPMANASTRVLALKPVNFEWIKSGTRTDGFLAHEAQAVVPECVSGTKDGMRDEEYQVSAATGDIYTPATDEADEVIHRADAEQPETLEDGQEWRETTSAVMRTRSVPDMQGIDQSKLVPLLVASLQEALARITVLENA